MVPISNMDHIFKPRSIALIGASNKKGSIGRVLLDNLLEYDFSGVIYPVNPKYKAIRSVRCYPSIKDIPDEIDLVFIAVPKRLVPPVLEECGQAGVKAAVIISAGFKEVGGAGIKLEEQVVDILHRYGIRAIGPNCMGIINMGDGVRLNGTFAPSQINTGRISFISQSGALGMAILDYIADQNLGINKFVSIGNSTDVSVSEIIDYLADDEDTDVILLYMEGFGDMGDFIPSVKRAVTKKPVIAVKSGRTGAGARAASSHTGSLAGSDQFADALFRQTGVLRAYNIEELFDMAVAFSCQMPPKGKNLAVITNGGGPGILTADAIEAHGMKLAQLSDKTKAILKENLPNEASIKNPVDMIASATVENYKMALNAMVKDRNVDGIIVIFLPTEEEDPVSVAREITNISVRTKKPIVGVFMGREKIMEDIQTIKVKERVPIYMFPESAARSMRALYDYGKILSRKHSNDENIEIDIDSIKEIINNNPVGEDGFLGLRPVAEILDIIDLPQPKWAYFKAGEDIDPEAAGLSYPLALKVEAPGLIHKSDAGAVKLGIKDLNGLKRSINSVIRALSKMGKEPTGYFLQEMAGKSHEVIVGMKRYKTGPLVMFGLGGVFVEVLKDVSFGVYPLSRNDAKHMISSIKGYPILRGARGGVKADLKAVEDIILTVSSLSAVVGEITELDLNPCILYKNGAVVVDARIKVDKGSG